MESIGWDVSSENKNDDDPNAHYFVTPNKGIAINAYHPFFLSVIFFVAFLLTFQLFRIMKVVRRKKISALQFHCWITRNFEKTAES